MKTGLWATMLAAVCTTFALPALSQTSRAPNHPGYAFGEPGGEALLALGALISTQFNQLPQVDTGWRPDFSHRYYKTAARASDVTGAYGGVAISVLAGYGLEAAYFGESGVRGGGIYALRTSLVDLEASLMTNGIVNLLKRLTGRCRPRYYEAGVCTSEVREAFPSGHTAPMAAMAGARLVFSTQSTGPIGFRWASFALAEIMAVSTAILRVRAGMHSWSDVIGGFLIGHAIGGLLGLLHPMQPVDPHDIASMENATAKGGFGLAWSGEF